METRKILIVDDDQAVCNLVSIIVKKCGFESTSITDAHDAIGIIENDEKIFLIITDLHMPMMTGYELVQMVHERFPYLKIIVMSSDLYDERILSIKSHVDWILDKFELYHGLKEILKKLQGENFVKESASPFKNEKNFYTTI
ncbi:MAG TPA: response regulator [bacterium]|nr:response regulator [bacterium]HPP09135.1 response regulator [bacterium]